MNFLTNIVAVLAFCASVVYILKRYPQYTVLFGFLSAMQFWALLSCFYNDLGVYNFELFRFTEASYATTRLGLFYLVFNAGFALMARLTSKSRLTRRSYAIHTMSLNFGSLKLGAYVMASLLGAYLVYELISGGIPLLLGLDRLAYYEQAGVLDRLVIGYGTLIAFGLGLTSRKRGRFSVNGVIVFLFLVYAVLIGHKFSFLSEILVGYFIPIFARKICRQPDFTIFRLKYALTALGTVSLFLMLAFSSYVRLTEGVDGASQLLMDRIFAGQGEIWWAVDYDHSQDGIYDETHWQQELGFIVGNEEVASSEVGMRYLMVKILGPERAGLLFDRGYLFTMAYPAILIMTFPYWLAIVLQLLAGMGLLLLLFYLHNCLAYGHNFRAVMTMMIILPMITVIYTGNFFVFFTVGMLIKAGLLIAIEGGVMARPLEGSVK